jgi:hypothetical protein
MIGHIKDDLNPAVATPRALQAGGELIERESFSARPDQRLHIEVGARIAVDRHAVVAALGRRASDEASDAGAPAELPGFAQGGDGHDAKEQNTNANNESSGMR